MFIIVGGFLISIASKFLIYDYGFRENEEMAFKINRTIIGKKSKSKPRPFCNLKKISPWNAELSDRSCDVIHPAHERFCGILTRGTNCFALQVPQNYSSNNSFLRALQIEISRELSGKYQWAYLLVQDIKTVNIITTKAKNTASSTHIVKIERTATYKITSGGKVGDEIEGAVSECLGTQDYCHYDSDIDLSGISNSK